MEKPAKVEVGQRWTDAGPVHAYTVVSVTGDKAALKFDSGASMGVFQHDQILCDEFLGYAPGHGPTSVPGEPTGQRDEAVVIMGERRAGKTLEAKDIEIASLKRCLGMKDDTIKMLTGKLDELRERLAAPRVQDRKKAAPEPWRPAVDDWDLLPDV